MALSDAPAKALMSAETGLITHPDGCARCWWPGTDPLYVAYHDTEWGVPEYDGRALFEKLILDGFQAGLSWITILRKRDDFRARLRRLRSAVDRPLTAEDDVARLMADAGIVRNRAKIVGTVAGARAYLEIEERGPASRASSGISWTASRSRTTPAAAPRSRPRRICRDAISKELKAGASTSSGRPSSMPSCRRSAWSTTTWSAATATRRAPRCGRAALERGTA